MIPDKFAELITGWLDGTLTTGQKAELRQHIEEGSIDQNELDELAGFYKSMEMKDVPEPTGRMHERFYSMLDTYKSISAEKRAHPVGLWLDRLREHIQMPKLAYGLVLLLLGFAGGLMIHINSGRNSEVNQLAGQIRSMQEMMVVTLLEQPSSFDRLKAVNISTDLSAADNKVINALLNTLNNDPNVNVRLAAVEALVRHAGNPLAREGLVKSIDNQDSPLVQVAMADAMVHLKEKKSVSDLKKLLAREDLNPTVKERIKTTIAKLL